MTQTQGCPEGVGYEPRFCAFLDILGFRSLVERSVCDYSLLHVLHDALSFVVGELPQADDAEVIARLRRRARLWSSPRYDDTWARLSDKVSHRFRGTAFSDSIVLSARAEQGELGLLLDRVVGLGKVMLRNGILVRGGLAYGGLVHSSALAFGPALVDAYVLESKHASSPRIVVSAEAASRIAQIDPATSGEWMLRRDRDGHLHVDILHHLFCYEAEEIREALIEGAIDADTSAREKWRWTAEYFNEKAAEHIAHGCIPPMEP